MEKEARPLNSVTERLNGSHFSPWSVTKISANYCLLDVVAFIPSFATRFATCADCIYATRRRTRFCFCLCFFCDFSLRICGNEKVSVRSFAVAAKLNRRQLARTLWAKPIIVIAPFANANAPTVGATLNVFNAPPVHELVVNIRMRKLITPLTAPRAKHFA